LSQWLGWADAISLSSALNANGTAAPAGTRPVSAKTEEAECRHVRSTLVQAITQDSILSTGKASAQQAAAPEFAPYRLRYQARQQGMDAGIGPLRERLRAKLATRSPAMGRLAAMDAVMAQVLGEQERRLLAGVPTLLEKRFLRLRQADEAGWLDAFGKDMQSVLLAELDIRFQPVEGLLQALRKS
jgi:hypothetical protein